MIIITLGIGLLFLFGYLNYKAILVRSDRFMDIVLGKNKKVNL